MKNTIILVLVLFASFFSFSQPIEDIDYISPFNNGVAAVKKGTQWGFINMQGELIIDFRNDLVLTETIDGNFPIFKSNRCLIEEKRDGISYFGYIDIFGATVIQPQFLNATNFNDGLAIVLEVFRESIAKNKALGKNIVYHKYLQGLVDTEGNIKLYLSPNRVNVILDKKFLKAPPEITSKYISEDLYAVKGKNNKWSVININQNNNTN